MGNILCKNRTNKTTPARTKSPVDRVIRNLQICPQSIGKKKYFWEKQILETSPPPATSQIQKDHKNGWQDATLAVPSNEKKLNDLDRPIPPPRKKRSNKLHNENEHEHHIKNGFEDVFLGDKENIKSKSLSNINNHIEQSNSPTTNSLSNLNGINDNNNNDDKIDITIKTTATTLPRKISKVGNKKSDKFFGENLSDCLSDEIIVTPKDNTEEKVISIENISSERKNLIKNQKNNDLQNVNLNDENDIKIDNDGVEEEELLRKINKEKGKLMFSIERQIDKTNDDDERYKGEIPVEEEIIVPVKKITKHICDDDHDIHIALHKNNNNNNISPNPSGPQKPQRDLAKYRKSLNKKDIIESSQIENESIIEQNKNHSKCDNETQTGKGGINRQDHKVTTNDITNHVEQQTKIDIDKKDYKVPSDILEHVTQQASLAINDILKSAEAAVEQQLKNETLKGYPSNKEQKETAEKMEERLNNMILSDDLITQNDKNNSIDAKITLESEKNLRSSETDLKSPEIKIDQIVEPNNILTDKNDTIIVSDTTKTESSTRPTRSSEIIPPNLSNSEKIFRRCLSTQSYLTSDLIEKIALQANILSMPGGFSPEDALQCNDGSGLVSPNFKLEQKRSLSPQISTISDKNDNEIKPITKIASTTTEILNNINNTEKSLADKDDGIKLMEKNIDLISCEKDDIDIKNEIINNINKETTATPLNKMPQSKVGKRVIRKPNRLLNNDNSFNSDNDSKREVSDTIKSFLNKKDLKPDKILDLIQDEFGDCIFSQNLPIEDKLIIEDLQKSIKDKQQIENIITTPTEIKSSFKFTEQKKYNNKSPSEKHKISKIPVLTNKNVDNVVSFNDKRRHSIDDLNAWFTPEKDFPLRKRKREASLPGSLDNPELYNGKYIHNHFQRKSVLLEQENEENIEKSANILIDDILSKAENNVNGRENNGRNIIVQKEQQQHYTNGGGESLMDINGNNKKFPINRNNNDSDEDDHSALLKFLEHEKLNN